MNIKLILFGGCLFFGIASMNAQDKTYDKAPLKEVLFVIEKTFDIKFSFSEEDITNQTITINFKDDDLATVLEKLQELTTLQFKKVTDRYITILNKTPPIDISGTLKDLKTEQPLQGGTITVLNKKKGTVSDENGNFELKNVLENDTINISYMGYQNQFFLAKIFKDNPNLSIALQESSDVLHEIIIQNYLTNGMVKKNDGSEEFKPQALGILPGLTEPDVLQSIQLLPGVQSPNETASGLHIRGGTPDQNLILFDGIKMYNSAHFFGMVSAFNPYIAQKIKVFRSGASAAYGNHISGVIDIQSDNVAPQKISGGLGTNLIHADAFLKIPINKDIGLVVSGRRSFTDLFNTITFKNLSKKVFQNTVVTQDDQIQENEQQERFNEFFYTDISTKLLIKTSKKDDIAISFLHNSNRLNYTIEIAEFNESSQDLLHFFNTGISALWNRAWNENLTQKTKIYYSNFDLTYDFNRKEFNNQIADAIHKTNVIKELQLQSVFNWKVKEKSSLSLGYEVTNSDVGFSLSAAIDNFQESDQIVFKEKNTTQAVFGEYVFTNQNKTSLHLGLRANYFSLTKDFFLSPRIYAQTKLLSNFWVKATAELKQQNISKVVEFFTEDFGLENQVWALANEEDIPVLESNQVSVGTIFKKNKWTIDMDVYRKEINGLTSLIKGFNSQNNDIFSEGKSTSLGLDIFLKKQWINYSSWISYSLSNTQFKFDDINNGKSFAGNYDAKHQFLWANSIKIKQFDFSLGWNFRTGIPYTNATGINTDEEISYETINAERLPAYHRLDFSTTYKFNLSTSKRWKGKIGFSLLNIYNQKNTLQRSYRIKYNENDTTSLVKTDTYSLGVTPNLVFRITF
ncbi:MAG: carboxypeptidase-like regulatory domain-containing protein [Flavobacteriaceae bacterium]|nr:carboxypeptidase-like regulatory domain-containing protein [Flavobacteriaceae bacterium]